MTTPALDKLRRNCLMLYISYVVSAVLCFYSITMTIICFFALLAAYAAVNKQHKLAEGTPYLSHLRWLQRTFWIGSLYFMAGNIMMGIYICYFTDLHDFMTSLTSVVTDPAALEQSLDDYANKNANLYAIVNIITQGPPTIWWLHRCWRGYVLLKKNQPVTHVTTWK